MRPEGLHVFDMVQYIADESIHALGQLVLAEAHTAEMECQLLHASVLIVIVDPMYVVPAALVC